MEKKGNLIAIAYDSFDVEVRNIYSQNIVWSVALNDFPKHNFMTCLLDVMMPKMDGYTLARKIREFNKSIPIIFITAKSLKEEKMKRKRNKKKS